MALVITLIMLSVTLVMAIAFLAVARRERNAVRISSDAANAKHGAEIALQAAEAQILANVMSSSNGAYSFSLLVSTNYINAYGYVPGVANATNVNFDYVYNGAAFSAADRVQDIANLLYLPRVPVMVNSVETNGRYYLDLNRNGQFEPTGPNQPNIDMSGAVIGTVPFEVGDPQWVGVLERPDTAHGPDNRFTIRYSFIAVPIGNALDINYIHNETVTRQVNGSAAPIVIDGFTRNQGVGSWEINLASFLADLNTNEWLAVSATNQNNLFYNYNEPIGLNNSGRDFDDARGLLSYRYNYNYNNLFAANSLFNSPNTVWPYDNIDEYSDGALQFTTTNIYEPAFPDNTSLSWAGSPNPNAFFTPSDFYDATKTQPGFASQSGFTYHLMQAGTNTYGNLTNAVPTYDRYTFYRMLGELGTDSEDDDEGKLDLNYDNTDGHGNIVPHSQTNLVRWTAAAFFTNAADRMVRVYTTNWFKAGPSNYLATYYGVSYQFYMDPATGYGYTNSSLSTLGMPVGTNCIPAFSLTNIPVYVHGQWVYSPSVHRLLQLAANIYDASTNNVYPNYGFFPSVFRPNFFKDLNGNGNVYVDGYSEIPPTLSLTPGTVPLDQPIVISANALAAGFNSSVPGNINRNVYGVPWVIGAKKNLPNFNQFYMQNTAQVTRKVQVNRTKVEGWHAGTTSADFSTNQFYIMSITNHIGCSFWNSYQTNYPGGLPIVYAHDICYMLLSNNISGIVLSPVTNVNYYTNLAQGVPLQPWLGANWNFSQQPTYRTPAANSFYPSEGDFDLLPTEIYNLGQGTFSALPAVGQSFPTNNTSINNLDQFALVTSNWFQAYIVDSGHVIDYVQFDGPNGARNLNNEIFDAFPGNNVAPYGMWYTNASKSGVNLGLANQLAVSETGTGLPPGAWAPPANMPSGLSSGTAAQVIQNEAQFFNAFFTGYSITYNNKTYSNTNLHQQAPFTPTRTVAQTTVWQANDPLVHYLASDLSEVSHFTGLFKTDNTVGNPLPAVSQRSVGLSTSGIIRDDRYQPWGYTNQLTQVPGVDGNVFNMAYRDPLVYSSDYWDFPGNHYPTVGWLGRVHRGTPWQTVFLKSTNILLYAYKDNPNAPAISGLATWENWSGNFNAVDATDEGPLEDRTLFDIFTTALNDNASRGKLSVNQTDIAAWSGVLGGMMVVSNATANPDWATTPVQTNMTILPAGPDVNSALYQIVYGPVGINATRTNTAAFPNGAFTHVGDILRVPMLSDSSPFVNRGIDPGNGVSHAENDISDEMYERIPQQLMGLVKVGTPRYVIYCYGQALRPAEGGTVMSTAGFGLVTNYQVVAESAARAILELHQNVQIAYPNGVPTPVTNYTTTVVNYNVLGPDQ